MWYTVGQRQEILPAGSEKQMLKELQNFWYYYRVQTVIALIVLAAGGYLLSQRDTVKYDYDIAIISPFGCSDGQLAEIRSVLEAAGSDQTGDGEVHVKLHLYRLSLGADGQDSNEIGALDADLVGRVSGIFFTEDPEAFEEATNGLGRASDAIPVREIEKLSGCGLDGFSLLPRKDSQEKYAVMRNALTA